MLEAKQEYRLIQPASLPRPSYSVYLPLLAWEQMQCELQEGETGLKMNIEDHASMIMTYESAESGSRGGG